MLQHRITLDTLFKSRLVGALSGKYGDFYFCFIAGTEMSEQEETILSKFSGRVFIFRRDEAPLNLERRAKEYSKYIAEWSMGLIDDAVLQHAKQSLTFFYRRHAFASASVEIDREGTASIQNINIDQSDFTNDEGYDEMCMVVAHQT